MREHWLFVGVVGVAAALRAATSIAYFPGLTFSDSWTYLTTGLSYRLPHFPGWEPIGYPVFLFVVLHTYHGAVAVTTIQHILGIGTGTLIYSIGVRHGAPRPVAAVGAAVYLLDGYVVSSEQWIASEALFTFLLTLGLWMTFAGAANAVLLPLAGVVLVSAASVRAIGLAVLPIWLLTIAFREVSSRARLATVATAVVVLGGYIATSSHYGGGTSFTRSGGWLLYGRVASIARCDRLSSSLRTSGLCTNSEIPHPYAPEAWVWDPRSPAVRHFGGETHLRDAPTVRHFAVEVIRQRPLAYVGLVLRDAMRAFWFGGYNGEAMTLPKSGDNVVGARSATARRIATIYVPDLTTARVRWPGAILRGYVARVHTCRILLGLLMLVSVGRLAVSTRLKMRVQRRRNVCLLIGSAIAMLLGAAAVNEYQTRQVLPTIPLLVCAATIATSRNGKRAVPPVI
jgi:hypothetical protein